MPKKLTADQREQVVDELIAQSGNKGIWQEKDRELLNNMSSRKLVGLLEQVTVNNLVSEDDLEEILSRSQVKQAARQGHTWNGESNFTANELNKLRKLINNEDPEDDEDDDDEEEYEEEAFLPKKGKKEVAVANSAPRSLDEWMETAPPEVRAMVTNAQAREKSEKARLIKSITSNRRSKFDKKALEAMTVNQLMPIAALATENLPSYEGAAAGEITANADELDQDDILLTPVINWGEGRKSA